MTLDISNEAGNYVAPGIQHKYDQTLLVIVSTNCHKVCDWCFRRRMMKDDEAMKNDVVAKPISVLQYASKHGEIRSILLTGGDALLADRSYMRQLILGTIDKLPWVKTVRLGTRAIVHDPAFYRWTLWDYVDWITRIDKKPVIVTHIVHPDEVKPMFREITPYPLVQTPLLRGINDDPEILYRLWDKLMDVGMEPYYVFQNRPQAGSEKYSVPVGEGLEIVEKAKARFSGLGKRVTYAISHEIGKLEVIGEKDGKIILRVHQAKDPKRLGDLLTMAPEDIWYKGE